MNLKLYYEYILIFLNIITIEFNVIATDSSKLHGTIYELHYAAIDG